MFFLVLYLTVYESCFATVFGYPGDKSSGGPAACTGKSVAEHQDTIGIAHRSLPCGTKVRVTYLKSGKSVVARVVDRGPYGAGTPGHDYYVKRRENESPPERVCRKINDYECLPRPWRGCVDLLPATASKIGFKGRGMVVIEVLD